MRTAIVTGGHRGIGLAVTRRLLAADFRVVTLGRNPTLPEDVVAETLAVDLTDIEGIAALCARWDSVDVLVNNAGVMCSDPWDAYPTEAKARTLALNLEAPIALITELAAKMPSGARVVNVASIAGQVGHPDIWYGATKAALINATKSFARQLAPRGITVTAVAPGPVDTAMLAQIPPERLKHVLGGTYSQKPATVDAVADAIAWLATDAPSHLSGTCIDLNDGAFPR